MNSNPRFFVIDFPNIVNKGIGAFTASLYLAYSTCLNKDGSRFILLAQLVPLIFKDPFGLPFERTIIGSSGAL